MQSASSHDLCQRISYHGKPQLISVDQFDRGSVDEFLQIATLMEPIAQRRQVTRVLEGAVLGNLFFEASTHSRKFWCSVLPSGWCGMRYHRFYLLFHG